MAGPRRSDGEPAVPNLVPQQAGANTEVAAAYGEEQAASEYGGIYLTTEHPVACVVCFTANIEQHRRRLMGLVPYPDHLTLRQVLHTARDLEEVRKDVERLVRGTVPSSFGPQLGSDGFVIAVKLPQDRDNLADELRRRFGSRVQVDQSL